MNTTKLLAIYWSCVTGFAGISLFVVGTVTLWWIMATMLAISLVMAGTNIYKLTVEPQRPYY